MTWLIIGLSFSFYRLPFGLIDVRFDVTATVTGGRLLVAGDTSLADGSMVFYDVWHEVEDDFNEPAKYEHVGSVVVTNGAFRYELDLHEWPPGLVHAHNEFTAWGGQAPHISETYGGHGERLSGPAVEHTDDGWVLRSLQDVRLDQGYE